MDTSELAALRKDVRRMERMLTDLDAMMTNRIGRLEQVVWPTPSRPPLGEELQQHRDRLSELAKRVAVLAEFGEADAKTLNRHLEYHYRTDKVRKGSLSLTLFFVAVALVIAYFVFSSGQELIDRVGNIGP